MVMIEPEADEIEWPADADPIRMAVSQLIVAVMEAIPDGPVRAMMVIRPSTR
jgi:hypothetical protein